jgi:hypothetical protein
MTRPILVIAGARWLFSWQLARHLNHSNDNGVAAA